MDAGSAFRRAFHAASPLFLAYYLLPLDLWIGFPRSYLAVTLWSVTLVIETLRLAFGLDIIGLRDYEQDQISAYFWGGTALTLGLLFFPPPFVVVVMCGMAWIDPLCAWTRKVGGYPLLPLVFYAVIVLAVLRLMSTSSLMDLAILATLASAVAIAAEYPTVRYVDDDFTMQMVPLLAMTLLGMLL